MVVKSRIICTHLELLELRARASALFIIISMLSKERFSVSTLTAIFFTYDVCKSGRVCV
jgi:hypothetical protein